MLFAAGLSISEAPHSRHIARQGTKKTQTDPNKFSWGSKSDFRCRIRGLSSKAKNYFLSSLGVRAVTQSRVDLFSASSDDNTGSTIQVGPTFS